MRKYLSGDDLIFVSRSYRNNAHMPSYNTECISVKKAFEQNLFDECRGTMAFGVSLARESDFEGRNGPVKYLLLDRAKKRIAAVMYQPGDRLTNGETFDGSWS